MQYIVKHNIVSRDIAGHKMDNEPQGQAGKRVVDSFSLNRGCDYNRSRLRRLSRIFILRKQATLANKIKSQQPKRANQFNIQHTFERAGRKTR